MWRRKYNNYPIQSNINFVKVKCNVKLPQLSWTYTSFDYNFTSKLLYEEIPLFRPGKTSRNNLFSKEAGFRVGQNKVWYVCNNGSRLIHIASEIPKNSWKFQFPEKLDNSVFSNYSQLRKVIGHFSTRIVLLLWKQVYSPDLN